ncbi:UV DNA damage endonuclease [Caloramator mitchellensis]|uniref:UV DNA damage endonuclease n=1 Tax=Caloramator mitchellensis TaxID=908809 RepID=A0A0R3JQU8_CALMK|nr:UV DNA damage repair endonuclease UvsE [Caloramator mitchellensis]KRQ85831.1 UV DNA damage endonuclease [Caloramator mitchellensis]
MRIGYACIPLGIDYRTNRGMNLKNFTEESFKKVVKDNLKDLKSILNYNIMNRIYMFRISSDIIPFGGHNINAIEWEKLFKNELKEIGEFIKQNNLRVSMHPGQYTVLNSPNEEVLKNSIQDIEYHCKFLDALSIDYSNKIVVHLGGGYNDKLLSMKRFIDNFSLLSDSSKKRLVIENDEKIYNISNVIEVSKHLNIPVVFDYFHHLINPIDMPLEKILENVSLTWKEYDGHMKLHYSEQSPYKKRGSHSEFIEVEKFLNFYNIVKYLNPDIMLEAKDKNISAIKCINILFNNTKHSLYEEWAKYKYLVMEKNYNLYKECSNTVNLSSDITDLYKKIDNALTLTYNDKNFLNTILHVWGYVNEKTTLYEREKFFSLINTKEYKKAKLFLEKLSKKYNIEYLLKSYYFIYDKYK